MLVYLRIFAKSACYCCYEFSSLQSLRGESHKITLTSDTNCILGDMQNHPSIHHTNGYKFGVPHKYFSNSLDPCRTQKSTIFRVSFIVAKGYKFKLPKGRDRKTKEETTCQVSGFVLPMEPHVTSSWPQCMSAKRRSSSKPSMARDIIGAQCGSTQMADC